MNKTWLAVIAIVAGCASSPSTNATPNTAPEVLIDASGRVYRTTDAAAMATFTASPDATFRALVDAYSELGMAASTVDPAQRVVARQQLLLRSRFQGERLSSAFDCGSGQFGPRADEGRITADVTSRVAASESGSSVTTAIQASLVANDGASRDPIRCVSNGKIEEKLREQVSKQLGIPYQRSR